MVIRATLVVVRTLFGHSGASPHQIELLAGRVAAPESFSITNTTLLDNVLTSA